MINNLEELKTCKGHITVIWNARSLLAKIEEVDRIALQAEPSFIGITESWLNTTIDSSLIRIDGYNTHRSDRTENSGKKSGGGLIWYYDSELPTLGTTSCSSAWSRVTNISSSKLTPTQQNMC